MELRSAVGAKVAVCASVRILKGGVVVERQSERVPVDVREGVIPSQLRKVRAGNLRASPFWRGRRAE